MKALKAAMTVIVLVGMIVSCAKEEETYAVAAAADAEDGWTKLFSDEAWYKNQPGKEEIFTGRLEAIPDADGPSTLMRTSYYRLGERTVYTRAKKVKALDALVGQNVEMRGKAVDMALEGRNIREIWPAAVRAAK